MTSSSYILQGRLQDFYAVSHSGQNEGAIANAFCKVLPNDCDEPRETLAAAIESARQAKPTVSCYITHVIVD